MKFKDLFADFVAGVPIKRKAWRGYWIYKYGRIEIHTKTGEVIDFIETKLVNNKYTTKTKATTKDIFIS